MQLNRSHLPQMGGFLLLSLLLHLLLLLLVPEHRLLPEPPAEEPVVVEMRPPEARERELDLPLPEEEKPRETPAKRLGPADQVVEKEIAPKGSAPEEQSPAPPAVPRSQAAPPAVRPEPEPQPQPKPQPRPEPEPQPQPAPEQTTLEVARPAPAPEPKSAPEEVPPRPRDLPDLSTLTRLPSATIARLEDQWRHKYRKDVEEGDAVWLDTERDILISFFQRFRDNIYRVWDYPSASAARREEGTSLLRITVNRDGTVRDVKVMESSGYRELDREAVAAVWKGSPYGDLPKAYQEDELNIFAFFEYTLSRRIVY